VGDRKNGRNSGTIAQYLEFLGEEIALTPAWGQPLETVFFGGGTPSLLTVGQIARLLELLDSRFGIAADAEISLEIDPGTFDRPQLQGYRDAGINRFSMGVQAFQDELLQLCGRSHTVADIWAAVELIHQVGVNNFSLDLISGLPQQTLEQWHKSLETAVAIAPTHISAYDLIVEPGTAFARYYQPGVLPLPPDETAAAMYRLAQQVLTNSAYQHYEISNYALSGYQCRHNRVYWENRPYYGFGMGATSYIQGDRFTRGRKTREYYQWVEGERERGRGGDGEMGRWEDGVRVAKPTLEDKEVLLETLMLGLRLAEGVSLSAIAQEFGSENVERIWHCLRSYRQQGLVEIVGGNSSAGRLRLTDPEGFLFSNTVLAALFSCLSF
jgi:oxygen-independent coproporphyrinogen-3 oxidase